jgi:hypothetical protein
MKKIRRPSPLRGLRGTGGRAYPMGTVAFYGPDNRRASKVAVAIVSGKDDESGPLERYFSEQDCRSDPEIIAQVKAFFDLHRPAKIVVSDGLMGCPHEEGIDYPKGEACPQCPYWRGRDRFSGEIEN